VLLWDLVWVVWLILILPFFLWWILTEMLIGRLL
jgi:hypothetical protein